MRLAIITSAPPDRPKYLAELLEVIALPEGTTGQFTYRRRWLSDAAWEALRLGQSLPAVLLYAEPEEGGPVVYPLRRTTSVRLDDPVPLDPTEETLLRLVFQLGPLFAYGPAAADIVKAWSERAAAELQTVAAGDGWTLNGRFVQLAPDDDGVTALAPRRVPGLKRLQRAWKAYLREEPEAELVPLLQAESLWFGLADVLSRTKLSEHAIFHIAGLYQGGAVGSAKMGPLSKLRHRLFADIAGVQPAASAMVPLRPHTKPWTGYRLRHAEHYWLRVLSVLPRTAGDDLRLEVKSDTTALSASFPLQRVAGQQRNETVFLQVQRVHERVLGTITVAIVIAPAPSATGTPTKPLVVPRVSIAVTCTFKWRVMAATGLGIVLGLMLANITPEALAAMGMATTGTPPRPDNDAYILGWFLKASGILVTAISAYVGFRKVPG